jgi:hypothetical protein
MKLFDNHMHIFSYNRLLLNWTYAGRTYRQLWQYVQQIRSVTATANVALTQLRRQQLNAKEN